MKIIYFFILLLFTSVHSFAGGGGAGGGGAGGGGAAGAGAAGSGGSAAGGAGGAAAGTGSAGTGAAASSSGSASGPGNSTVGAASAAASATGGTLVPTGNAFHYAYMYTDVVLEVSDVDGTSFVDWEAISISEAGSERNITFSPILLSGTDYRFRVENTAPGFACETATSNGTTTVDNQLISTNLKCFSQFENGNLWSIWPRSVAPGTELKLSGDQLSNATVLINDEVVNLLSQSEHEIKLKAPELDSGVHKLEVIIPENNMSESYFLTYNAIQVSELGGGADTRCALLENGQIDCWGWRNVGSIPITYPERNIPSSLRQNPYAFAVTAPGSATSISSGSSLHTCYIDSNSKVHCFGGNYYAGWDAAEGFIYYDVAIPNTEGAIKVDVGAKGFSLNGAVNKSCSVMSDKTIKCWSVPPRMGLMGVSPDYLDGLESTNEYLIRNNSPITQAGFTNIIDVKLSSFDDNLCALLEDGRVQCVGRNDYGQLGNGTTIDSSIPVFVDDINDAISLSYNGATGCVILQNGNAKCWGANTVTNFMGIGASQFTATPIQIHSESGLVGSIALSNTGKDIVCSANNLGSLTCWGESDLYSAGWWDDINAQSNIIDVKSNSGYGWCFIENGGGVRCSTPVHNNEVMVSSGNGLSTAPGNRALGRGFYYNSPMALAIPGLTNVKKVSVSSWMPTYFTGETCALDYDGNVSCWGSYADNMQSLKPDEIEELPLITDIAMIRDKLYVVDDDKNLLRWDGSLLSPLASNVVSLSNSGDCYVNTSGNIACLVSDTGTSFYIVQSQGDAFIQVSNHCGLRVSGKVGCWQNNQTSAINVINSQGSTLEGITEIKSNCGRLANGDVDCWKYSSSSYQYKVDVSPAITNISKLIDTPESSVCGLGSSGEIKCYGDSTNSSGLYGASIPVEYTFKGYFTLENGLSKGSIKSASINGTGACGVLQDHTVACWGENLHGMLAEKPNGKMSFLEQHILSDPWLGVYQAPPEGN